MSAPKPFCNYCFHVDGCDRNDSDKCLSGGVIYDYEYLHNPVSEVQRGHHIFTTMPDGYELVFTMTGDGCIGSIEVRSPQQQAEIAKLFANKG